MAGHVGTLGKVDTVPTVDKSLTLACSLGAGPNLHLLDIATNAGRYLWSSL